MRRDLLTQLALLYRVPADEGAVLAAARERVQSQQVLVGVEHLRALVREEVGAAVERQRVSDTEMAARWGVDVRTWRRWVAADPGLRALAAVQAGGRRMWRPADVLEYWRLR